jgi:ATP-dependent DNA helicase RecQ
VLSLNAQSGQVLREELIVRIAAPVKRNRARSSPSAGAGTGTGTGAEPSMAAAGTDSSALFERLRALRKRLADEHGLPPYVVFHDATLREMAEHRPLTFSQFAELPGVGQAKLARYGEHFIAAIALHLSQNRP